jgi:glutamate 5-kinase
MDARAASGGPPPLSRESSKERLLPAGKTIVLKFGTSSLLSEDGCNPKLSNIARLVEVAVRLRNAGHSVVIVSSGAVGTGCARMKLKQRPDSIAKKQAMASIGQLHLMRIYDEFFSTLGHTCSQVRCGGVVRAKRVIGCCRLRHARRALVTRDTPTPG